MNRSAAARSTWTRVAVLLITVLPLAFVLRFIDGVDPASALAVARPVFLLPGLALMVAYVVLGGLRIRTCTRGTAPAMQYIPAHAIGIFARTIVPAGIGEVAYVSLLRRCCVPIWTEAITATIACRCLDVLAGFAALCLWLPWLSMEDHGLLVAVLGPMAAASAGIVLVYFVLHRAASRSNGLSGRAAQFVRSFAAHMAAMRAARLLIPAIILTALMHATLFGVYLCICRALAPRLSPFDVAALFLLLWPLSLLPIRGILDLGTHEGSWMLALVALGCPRAEAALIAVGSHAVLLIAKALIAGVAVLFLLLGRRASQSACDQAAIRELGSSHGGVS